jgi:hypothetical protein
MQILINKINLEADSLIRCEWEGLDYTNVDRHIRLSVRLLELYEANLSRHKMDFSSQVYNIIRIKLVENLHYSLLDLFLRKNLIDKNVRRLYESQYLRIRPAKYV